MTPEEARKLLDDDPDLCGSHRLAVSVLIEEAVAAERERCAAEAELVAENYRESAVTAGADEPLAMYRSREAGARAVARRIREGGAA